MGSTGLDGFCSVDQGNHLFKLQCRRPLRWGPAQVFFVLSAAFGWFRLAGLLACSLACLFACFQRFSRPHSFAHSEHQPKECYIESRQLGPQGATSKNSFASSALGGRTRFAAASTNQRSAPAAERKRKERWAGIVHAVKLCVQRQRPATKASLPALFQAALVCPQRAPAKGVRRQQKGTKKRPNGRARTRLPTASNQRSAPAAERPDGRAVTELQR